MAEENKIKAFEELEAAIGSRKVGDIFLELGYLTKTQLNRALDYQKYKGGKLGWILVSLGFITRLELYEGLAEHFSMEFETSVPDIMKKIDRPLATMLTHEEMVKFQVVPYYIEENILIALTSDPEEQTALELLAKRFGVMWVKEVVITDLDLMRISEELFRDSLMDASVNGLINRNADESACRVATRSQFIFLLGLLGVLAAWGYFAPASLIITLLCSVQLFFAVPIFFKVVLCLWGRINRRSIKENKTVDSENESGLPVYTILIAAYKEKEVIGDLIKSIKKMDYPEDKLDIILLLEEGDNETLEAARLEKPAASWRFLVLPNRVPKTKPKALNYGLHFARGEYLTIYDAEDIPEPDQLKKSVAAFRSHPDDFICFQAALNYFNTNQNFLTKMFTLEYSSWFDCLLPGLFKAGLPIPLGGTSNHFHVEKLRQIGAWDPFNVTEDADLGIRASVRGYKVGVIDSTTYEEANSQLPNWLRQRSRWVKGYMQTFLVHSRHPLKAIRAMGLKRWLGYTFLIGGTPVNFILNPIMWLLFVASFFYNLPAHMHVPDFLFYLAYFNLYLGNALCIILAMMGVISRKHYNLVPYALLSPVYWMLQSFGAYKGLWQLMVNPFYWEKTTHGLTKYKVNP